MFNFIAIINTFLMHTRISKIIVAIFFILNYFIGFGQHSNPSVQDTLQQLTTDNHLTVPSLTKEISDSTLYTQAYSLIKQHHINEANQLVTQLQKKNPKHEDVYFLKGLLFALKGKYASAISNFNSVLDNNPKHEKALYNRALAKALLDDYKSAIEDLNKCISINPSYTLAYYSRGYWYEVMRNFEAAISDYQKTITLDKYFNEAYLALAYVYYETGNKINACETLKKADAEGINTASEFFQNYCQ
jgi:tetratricopeptide (TPR) repeat protein